MAKYEITVEVEAADYDAAVAQVQYGDGKVVAARKV